MFRCAQRRRRGRRYRTLCGRRPFRPRSSAVRRRVAAGRFLRNRLPLLALRPSCPCSEAVLRRLRILGLSRCKIDKRRGGLPGFCLLRFAARHFFVIIEDHTFICRAARRVRRPGAGRINRTCRLGTARLVLLWINGLFRRRFACHTFHFLFMYFQRRSRNTAVCPVKDTGGQSSASGASFMQAIFHRRSSHRAARTALRYPRIPGRYAPRR